LHHQAEITTVLPNLLEFQFFLTCNFRGKITGVVPVQLLNWLVFCCWNHRFHRASWSKPWSNCEETQKCSLL